MKEKDFSSGWLFKKVGVCMRWNVLPFILRDKGEAFFLNNNKRF